MGMSMKEFPCSVGTVLLLTMVVNTQIGTYDKIAWNLYEHTHAHTQMTTSKTGNLNNIHVNNLVERLFYSFCRMLSLGATGHRAHRISINLYNRCQSTIISNKKVDVPDFTSGYVFYRVVLLLSMAEL